MRERLRAYSLKHDEALEDLRGVLERNRQSYAQACVRCVSVEVNGAWRNALCVIKVDPLDHPSQKKDSCRYQRVHLLEEWLELGELVSVLNQIPKGILKVDGEEVALGAHSQFNEWEYLPSQNEFSGYPGYVFRTSSGERLPIFHHEPLVSYKLPFYPNPYLAMQTWNEFSVFHGDRDARIGTLQAFFPQCWSHFESLSYLDNRLSISVTGCEIPGLKVKGAWEYQDGCTPFEAFATRGKLSIEVPEHVEGFEVYLVGLDETLYDFHRETRFWALGQKRVFGNLHRQGTEETAIHSAIQSGEGESVEYKPFLKKGDAKYEELVRTVIAFANTKGGVILLGVNDQCIIEGIEKDIAKEAYQNNRAPGEELTRYSGWLKQSVLGELNRGPALEGFPLTIEGHTLVVLRVTEGEEKPYANTRTNAIYIRRGANNVVPHPDLELHELLKSSLKRQATPWEG